MPKAQDQEDRDNIEAQLMGGEVQAESTPEPEPRDEPARIVKEVESAQPEAEAAPEETLADLKGRLAKVEEERTNYQRAMQEERESKKTSERTLQTLLDRLEAAQKEKEPQEQIERTPVYEEDPAAYLKWQNDQILEDRRREVSQRQEQEKLTTEQRKAQELHQTIKAGFNKYAEQTPDYNDAAKFLIDSRIKELEIMGERDKDKQLRILQQEEVQVGSWALQRGISPGELVYNLAKSRGYQKAVQEVQGVTGNDKPRPKSLSNISGSPSGNKDSLQARAERILAQTNLKGILSLDPDEMEKILKEAR